MIWDSISIKKIEDNDCDFFKKFSVKYSMVIFASLMKLSVFEKLSLEELEVYIKEKEKHSKIEMIEIKNIFLMMGIDIETPTFDEEREFLLKNIYTDQFKEKNILEIFEVISNIEEFISLFIIVEDVLKKFLNSKGENIKNASQIIKKIKVVLEEENKKDKFLKEMKDKTYLKNLKDLKEIWELLTKMRNLIAHSYGDMNEKNIEDINKIVQKIISILDIPTSMLLSDMDSLLNPFEGIPERDDIKNRPILKEGYIIPFDSITCRFLRNFFIYFMESLNETFKN